MRIPGCAELLEDAARALELVTRRIVSIQNQQAARKLDPQSCGLVAGTAASEQADRPVECRARLLVLAAGCCDHRLGGVRTGPERVRSQTRSQFANFRQYLRLWRASERRFRLQEQLARQRAIDLVRRRRLFPKPLRPLGCCGWIVAIEGDPGADQPPVRVPFEFFEQLIRFIEASLTPA